MALSHFADLVNPFPVDCFVGIGKVPLNKWLPMFLCNRPERVMTACTVKRPISVEHHFLNQMFAAAEEQIAHSAMVLNHAPQLPLHVIAAIFEGLLAADEVFIPLQPHFLALHGMGKLLETTALVGKRINPSLKVTGIVLCLFESASPADVKRASEQAGLPCERVIETVWIETEGEPG